MDAVDLLEATEVDVQGFFAAFTLALNDRFDNVALEIIEYFAIICFLE